jgi:ABC-type multidrug transport system fused ATPase/permease subunit
MFNFKKIFYLLDFQERKRAVLLILMIIGMALLDTIGIASILPFMAVLTNPGIIETNLILKYLFEFSFLFGIKDIEQFLFALGVIVFMMLMISFIFKTLTTYFQVEFIQMCEYSFGKRLMEIYLKQPYSWFLTNHSSDIGKNILSEVEKIVLNCLRPLIELIAKGIVTICIICLLLLY